jgi:hypothetical protein
MSPGFMLVIVRNTFCRNCSWSLWVRSSGHCWSTYLHPIKVGSPLLGLPLGLMGWGNRPIEFWKKPEKEHVCLREWKGGTSPELDYFRVKWNRDLVEKHKTNVKPIQIRNEDFHHQGRLAEHSQSGRVSSRSLEHSWSMLAQQSWPRLCSGLFNSGVAGAGEICIPCTRILTPLGQLTSHNSGGMQICDE